MAGMIAPILALAIAVQSKVGYGSELYNNCQAYLSFMKPGQHDHLALDETNAHSCFEYVSGFLDGDNGAGGFCQSGHAIVFYIQSYVAYMDQHPDLLEKSKPTGLRAVMKEQFPCQR